MGTEEGAWDIDGGWDGGIDSVVLLLVGTSEADGAGDVVGGSEEDGGMVGWWDVDGAGLVVVELMVGISDTVGPIEAVGIVEIVGWAEIDGCALGDTEGAFDVVVSGSARTAKLEFTANKSQMQHCSEDCIDIIMMKLFYFVFSDDIWWNSTLVPYCSGRE